MDTLTEIFFPLPSLFPLSLDKDNEPCLVDGSRLSHRYAFPLYMGSRFEKASGRSWEIGR
jgi:hypothetical protein